MTATATHDPAQTPDLSCETVAATGPSASAILPPGQTATVYTGAENRTFNISLTGTIHRDAALVVTVDNTQATTLTFDIRSTIVNGRSVTVSNRGRESQGFVAQPIV